ncbi:MAG: hypothetical protein F6K36_02570 [Symploca sp. SIO3C6]|nr:hypothetical protein [Symploca sp. SIO3C6]
MYVYRTPQFNSKVERYGIQERIEQLCAELETQSIDEVQGRFERIYPYLKRRILNRRVIGRILRIDQDRLLCLVDIFKRGDKDYEQFLETPVEYGENHLETQLDLARLQDWLVLAKIQQPLKQELPELPSTMKPWLEPPGWEMDNVAGDWVIYESEEWVRRFRKPEIQVSCQTYYQIITGIRTKTIQCSVFPDCFDLKLSQINHHYVLYSELEDTDTKVGGVLLLLAPFNYEPSSQEIIRVGENIGLFDNSNPNEISRRNFKMREFSSLQALTPLARRFYPAYLLADEDSWLAIEQGQESNLALSSEEEQILNSVSTSTTDSGSLPLFINGRAGSGKSTMLLYLFADYCYRKYYNKQGRRRPEPLPGEPLFITYNQRLIEVARDGVKKLLSSHHRFVAERSQGDEMPSIEHNFRPFGEFLLELLTTVESDAPGDSLASSFPRSKYISFHRFKQLYQGTIPLETPDLVSLQRITLQLPQRRRYSAEICWHVIRTFIKGYALEGYMTPEDYIEEVPRRSRTIDLEKYQGIYDTIWEHWYKPITQEQGYWDDQDLIAKVLELHCYSPCFAAIFCDEAQDFTKLELQLITRLSIFPQYNLGYQPIPSLPFVFAGDPLQTLNPTGFSWSRVKAVFESAVIRALDPAEQLKLKINFQELSFNYRSSPPIVKFTNLIQLWRHVLFNIPQLKPQLPWQQSNFREPQKFIINQDINIEQLRSYIKDTIIILPCEQGEELAYAKADEVLSEIVPSLYDAEYKYQEHSLPKNILSAIATKGLEFKKVILYKFGEDCNQNVWNLKTQPTDQRVKVEYFFNKLYVAASRATEHLFVVDSERGNRQLWQYASDEALLHAMRQHAKNKELWEENVCTISPGNAKYAQELQENEPQMIAQEFETKGLNSESPSLLRRARQFYYALGDTFKAEVCETWALKFEEFFKEAGSRFLQLGNQEQAWECFWYGMCWEELVAWYNLYPDSKIGKRPLVIFMAAPSQDWEAIKHFTSFIREQLKNGKLKVDVEQQKIQLSCPQDRWQEAVEEYAKRIDELLDFQDLNSEQWQQLGELLETLKSRWSWLNFLAGKCFYRAQKYEQAVRNWEDSDAIQTQDYNKAKALSLGIPEGLEYLTKVGEYKIIITEWEQIGKPRDHHWLKYVALALENLHQYQKAFVVYIWLDELIKVKECFERLNQEAVQVKILTIFLQYLYRKQSFKEALEIIEKYLPIVIVSDTQKSILKFDFVYQLACSELIPEDVGTQQKENNEVELYEKFFKEQVLSTSDWHQYLLMPQVGIALEKIGLLVETIEFYDRFVSSPDPELQQFARERWIATRKKQENYAKEQGHTLQASRIRSEILNKARSWLINQQLVPIEPPPAPRERPKLQVTTETIISSRTPTSKVQKSSTNITKPVIVGLPQGTKIEYLENEVFQFMVRHLVIRIVKQAQQVLIIDTLNNREVRLDWAQCKVHIGEATVEADGGSRLSFALSSSAFSGNLVCDDKQPRLQLDVQGLSQKINLILN